MAALIETVESEQGVIVNVAGDGFFAIFGVPIGLPQGAANAVRAADKMAALVANRNREANAVPVPDVHIGIAAGEVLVSPSDSPLGWSVLGNAINLASRLCDSAGPGETLVDDETFRLVGASATWAEHRTLDVKGRSGHITAHQLAGAMRIEDTAATNIPFVGREDVLGALDSCWSQVRGTGRAAVVAVEGEAGIGKTAVVRRWLADAPDRRAIWHWCGSGAGASSAVPLMQALAAETPALVDRLNQLIQGDAPPDLPTGLRADPLPQLVALARAILADLGRRGPVVVVIDDAHAAGEDSRRIIEGLAHDPPDSTCLVIAIQRNDEPERVAVGFRVELAPLDEAATATLLSAAFGIPPPEDLEVALHKRVRGHPLMALQSAAYLRESGIVIVRDGVAHLTDPTAIDNLPSSLRMFISARLDRLPALERDDLRHMSALGDEWTDDWVSRVLGAPSRQRLELLAARGLLEEVSHGVWRFAHSLVQSAAYASLTRRDRAALHHRQLEMLTDPRQLDAKARHALAWADAVPVSNAGEHREATIAAATTSLALARDLYASGARSAEAVLRRALSVIADVHDVAADLTVEMLLLTAECLIELGQFEEALQASATGLDAAAKAALPAPVRARCLLVRGHALSRLRRFEGARQALDDAVAIAERENDGAVRARALRLMANTWRHSLVGRMSQLVEEAYDAFCNIGDDIGAAECARELAYIHSLKPQIFARWDAIAERTTPQTDIRGQAWMARSRVIAYGTRFDYETAGLYAERAAELADQCGAVDVLFDALANCVSCRHGTGDLDGALHAAEQLFALAESQGNPRMRLVAAAHVAPTLSRAGRRSRAVDALEYARSETASFGPTEERIIAIAETALNRDRGAWRDAAAGLQQSIRIAAEEGHPLFTLEYRIELARVQLHLDARLTYDDYTGLRADATAADAPLMASYIDALFDQAAVDKADARRRPSAHTGACLEERAIRADTAALQLETVGEDPTPAWREARGLWERLGYTVWLARAQSRSGDVEAAKHTLDVLDSPAEARAWALAKPGTTAS